MEQKRKPISKRVRRVIFRVALSVLVITSLVALFNMFSIRKQSSDALTQQLETNLSTIAADKAAYADAELGKFREFVVSYAELMSDMYAHPENYVGREVYSPMAKNKGRLTMQRYLRDESVALGDVREEMELFANLEPDWRSTIKMNPDVITTIYLGTESGLHIAYDGSSELGVAEGGGESYFDYSDSQWYQNAKQELTPGFTDIYSDSYDRGLMVSCYAPVVDGDGELKAVVCMDMLISDIYQQIVSLDIGEGGSVYLIDRNGHTVDPNNYMRLLDVSDVIASEEVRKEVLDGKTGFTLSEDGIYSAYAPVEIGGWELCINVPRETVLSSATRINRRIINAVLTFLAVLAGVIAAVFFSSRRFAKGLTEPLIALGEDTVKISQGDLDYRAKAKDNDEIGDLANRFNEMADNLKHHIDDLTRVTAEKERIGAELNVATQIQADMLPRIFPAFPEMTEIDVYASMTPAKEVGGDFYDFFLVDDTHIALVMADVSDKGVPAALFMVIAKTLIKNRTQMGGTPAEILTDVNNQLCEGNEAGLFVTVWLAIVDITTGKGLAANAGHEHPALRRKDEGFALIKYKHSPVLAALEGVRFAEHEFELSPGDAIFVYTDGVTEATNADLELFGEDRLIDVLNENPNVDSQQVLVNVKNGIDAFVGDAVQFDDITMLCFEYYGTSDQ